MTQNADPCRCNICRVLLNQEGKPETRDCGGDCLRCVADCGDLDCAREMVAHGFEQYRSMLED